MKTIRKFLSVTVIIAAILMSALPAFAQAPGAVELVGTIEAMTLDTVTVNGQVITISTAEINAALEIGAVIKIEGTLDPGGSITAREVNLTEAGIQPDEAELIGVLESFDGTSAVINGQMIDVSGAEVKAGFVIGERVKVHATATAANTWVAREAEPFVPNDDGADDDSQASTGEFEITGTLDEVGDGFIVVSGQTIAITDAEIKDTLVVGVLVKVHVSPNGDGLAAREVENATQGDDNQNDNDNQNTNDNLNVNDNSNANSNTDTNDNGQIDTPTVDAQQATGIVTSVYPNTTITEMELETKFGGTLVWEVKTSHGIELIIDATSGAILVIDRDGDDNGNGNSNSNDNDDDDNDNANVNGNDNDDNGNDNDDDDNDNDDDNSGMGSDDDDNSGMGSDDD